MYFMTQAMFPSPLPPNYLTSINVTWNKLEEKLFWALYILYSVKYLIVSVILLWKWKRNMGCMRILSGGFTSGQNKNTYGEC